MDSASCSTHAIQLRSAWHAGTCQFADRKSGCRRRGPSVACRSTISREPAGPSSRGYLSEIAIPDCRFTNQYRPSASGFCTWMQPVSRFTASAGSHPSWPWNPPRPQRTVHPWGVPRSDPVAVFGIPGPEARGAGVSKGTMSSCTIRLLRGAGGGVDAAVSWRKPGRNAPRQPSGPAPRWGGRRCRSHPPCQPGRRPAGSHRSHPRAPLDMVDKNRTQLPASAIPGNPVNPFPDMQAALESMEDAQTSSAARSCPAGRRGGVNDESGPAATFRTVGQPVCRATAGSAGGCRA